MAAIAVAAGGMMMMCCSSSVAALMMGGEEKEDPIVPLGPSPGPSASSPTHSTPLEGKIYNTDVRVGWVDPGAKSVEGHIGGTSIKDCYDKAPEGAVIAGWRSSEYADADYQDTCFYYNSSQSGEPGQVIANHTIACMDSTKDISKGCGVPRVSGTIYGTGADLGWSDPGPKPNGTLSNSLEGCIKSAPSDAVIVGHRDGAYASPEYQNTCFYYTQAQSGAPTQLVIGNHHVTCKDPSKTIASGCA